jgi:hypothetical protein
MTERIAAIVRADVMIRFRRVSTLIIFLLLSASVYVWVPDPSGGSTLIQIGGRRALYNSASIGLATSMLATLFVGLFGFYVISNAVRRDVISRCGFVAASTEMRTHEYLLAKFAGNVVFLTTFMTGFMLAAMAMLIVRAEAPLEPWVFAKHYAIVVPSTIVFVSVLAIVFESVPWLSGRLGDVIYFFMWAASLGFVVATLENSGSRAVLYFDVTGLGYLFDFTKSVWHTKSLSIGHTNYDVTRPPIVVSGIYLTREWFLMRLSSTLVSLPLLGIALVFFHRFDPARVRTTGDTAKRSLLRGLNRITKPLVQPFAALAMRGPAMSDAMLTMTSLPLTAIAFIGFAIATLAGANVLIPAFLFIGIFVADVATRDRRANTLGFIDSSPRLQARFVIWKLTSSLIVAGIVMSFPLIRAAMTNAQSAISMLVAIFFVCAAATSLGVISGNPKTFIVIYLTLWYAAVNDKGATPGLNFAGFVRAPSPAVMASYFAASIAMLTIADCTARLRRAEFS